MQVIKNREVKIYSCYQGNISTKIIEYQKRVFDYFSMDIEQEYCDINHPEYLTEKINNEDFDIIVFFDIDCIPLRSGLYEYIVDVVGDNNSLIGIEQSANHINSDYIFAGPACFSITKEAYIKMNKPSFRSTREFDTAGEVTYRARECEVNVKYFNITSSLNKKWRCGKKYFGNGTIYDDWLYHQFELGRYYKHPHVKILEYEFINKCKEVLKGGER